MEELKVTSISKNYFQTLWLVPLGIVMSIYFFFIEYKVVSSFIWLVSVGVYLSYSFVRGQQGLPQPELRFERSVSGEYFFQTAEIHVQLTVHNDGEGAYRGEVIDLLPHHVVITEGNNRQMLLVPPSETRVLEYKFTYTKRGKYLIGPINYMYHSSNEKDVFLSQDETVDKFTIVPLPIDITTFPTIVKHLRSIGGPFPSKLTGEGWSFSGIRDYLPTDSMRWINWKATARLSTLQTNEFELQRSSKILIILDLADEPSDVLEQSIRAALGLSYYLISSTCKVGLITIGKYVTYFPPTSSRKKLIELSEHLTTVQVGMISNRELFKNRILSLVNKLQSDHEVLVFSSLSDKFLRNFLLKVLPMIGHSTIFTPDFTSSLSMKENDATNEAIKQLFILNRSIVLDKALKSGINIRFWNPSVGFSKLSGGVRR